MADTDRKQSTTSATSNSPLADLSPSPPPASGDNIHRDRRMSDEWDASKVPPSRFQKRKGSIYAVPGSRDGHVDSNYAHKFYEKHAEKGYTGFGKNNGNNNSK